MADIIGSDGKAVSRESIGGSYDAASARFSPFRFKTGKPPHGLRRGRDRRRHRREEALQGRRRRHRLDARRQARVPHQRHGVLRQRRLARHRQHRRLGRPDGPAAAAPRGPVRRDLGRGQGRHDAGPARPHDPARCCPRNLEVKDADQQAKDDATQLNDGMAIIRYVLLGFGGIALFVGAFVIFNTLSITVAQRTREFATLRTLGATRRQIKRSVRIEGLVIGLIASVIGLLAGVGIAKGLIGLFSMMGVDLPEAGTVIASRTITTSLILGTGITLLASILPARRAMRVPPIAAVREGATLPASALTRSSASGIGVTGDVAGRDRNRHVRRRSRRRRPGCCSALGVLGLFGGIALLAPRLVKPLARVVGLPARRAGGVAGDLAAPTRSATRAAPRRPRPR